MPGPGLRRALCIAASAFVLGCASAQAQPRIQKYLELKEKRQWKEALALAREEVASPSSPSAESYVNLRIIAIGALGDYARAYGLQPGLDEEAGRYFREGIAGTQDERRAAGLRNVYGRYFSQTKRNGRALPYYRENLEVWRRLDQRFLVAQSLDALATLSGDRGEIALRDHYRRLALAAAAEYFTPGRGNPTPNQWQQYAIFLERAMNDGLRAQPLAELDRIWALREEVNRFVSPGWTMYTKGAQYYAAAGALDRAEQQLAKARELKAPEASVMLASGIVHAYVGRAGDALAPLEREQRARVQTGKLQDDLTLPRVLGLAYERTGALAKAADSYRAAIRLSERLRDSYDVADRAAFFRTTLKEPYHGLIRVSARQAATARGIEPFWRAVQASEMVRARQLGDLIDPDAGPLVTRESLESLRARLGPGRAVLYLTLAGDDLVILGFTSERHVALVEPVDRSFAESVRRVASDLSRPQAPIPRIEQGLAMLGATLLRPLADILASRQELVVLPDGILNLIPFDLLSFDPNGYRPLVDTHRVRLTPSLRFAERAREQKPRKGVFVLADPVYKPPAAIGGIPPADVAGATRASSHLAYFQPLPETRTEAAAVGRMFGAGRIEMLLGEDATESALKRADLRGFSHLHFATHGILGEEVPGIGEPALVLAHEAGEDGFLTASEIARLRLDADLAVLSACNTGSGEYVTGEGVMGLSRAFLIAGSRSVVVSLWPVASQATERLMGLFYAGLGSGKDSHDALRDAKLKFRDDARKAGSIERHPMFWAPFVVFGS